MFLADGGWESDIRWGSEDDEQPASVVPLDMNDPDLIFRLLRDSENAPEMDKAAAIVLPPLPKVHSGGLREDNSAARVVRRK